MADLNPLGGDGAALKKYWLAGPGLRRWSSWTSLRRHLLKYMNPHLATLTATRWYFYRYGVYPNSDVARLRNGKPIRGKLIGPG